MDRRSGMRWAPAAAALLVAAAALLLAGCERAPPPEPVKLRFAATRFVGEMLSFVALDKGFFAEQGLQIELSYSSAGWQSLKRLFEGQADVATVAQLPVVYSALDRRKYTETPAGDFAVVADLTSANRAQAGIGRRDRGINGPADLRGKTIGVPRGTTVDFFLESLLRRHRLSEADVTIVDIDVARLPEALIGGKVDAIFGWQPHSGRALKALGDNGVQLEVGQRYPSAWLVVFMKDYLRQHPGVAERFLRAIAKAEDHVRSHPEEGLEILARHLNSDVATVREAADKIDYQLSLSEALLVMMDEQARWALRRGIAPVGTPPNFLDYVDQAPLKRVKPAAITLIQ